MTHSDSVSDDLGTTRFLRTFATGMLEMAAETDDPAFPEVGGAAERSDEIKRIERASREVYQNQIREAVLNSPERVGVCLNMCGTVLGDTELGENCSRRQEVIVND